ncbi:MAG TPA: tRNA nucleotidyltransferase, partial [bacterium]|nr:tRNA nucleotidyltransferase [bacterium]
MRKKNCNPEDVLDKMRKFAERKNIPVFLVGGYIRDRMLRKKSKDIDVVMEYDALSFARQFAIEFGLPQPVFYGRFGTAMLETGGIKIE